MTPKITEIQPAVPSFPVELGGLRLTEILRAAGGSAAEDGRRALADAPLSIEAAATLLQCPVDPVIDDLVEHARVVTQRSFGRSIFLRAPVYLSSFCKNHCDYCGRRWGNDAPRVWLSPERVRTEMVSLARHGLKRVVLVAAEDPKIVTAESVTESVAASRTVMSEIDLLLGSATEKDYRAWKKAGAQGVVCYQETYDPLAYASVHSSGPKTHYDYRLGTLERAGAAGMDRLGLGVLLGLSEPGLELLSLIAHARFLARRFPHAQLTLGIPRAFPRPPVFLPRHPVDDLELLRDFAVLRLALPDAGLAVSTREPEWIRGRLLACATEMSVRPPVLQDTHVECAHDGGLSETMDWRSAEELQWEMEDLGYSVRRPGPLRA